MWRLTVVLAFVGLCLASVSYIIGDIGKMGGDPLTRFGVMFFDSDPILKVSLLLLGLAAVVMVFSSLPKLLRPSASPDTDMLMVLGYGSVGLGLVAATYGAYNIYRAVQSVGPVSFPVMAPSVAEAVFVAAVGCVVGAVGVGLRTLIQARRPSS